MTTKKPKVTIYIAPEVKTKLDDWAKEENRSVTNLVETILIEAVAERPDKSKPEPKSKTKKP